MTPLKCNFLSWLKVAAEDVQLTEALFRESVKFLALNDNEKELAQEALEHLSGATRALAQIIQLLEAKCR